MIGFPDERDSENYLNMVNYLKRQVYKPHSRAPVTELFLDSEGFRAEGQVISQLNPENSHLYGEFLRSKQYSFNDREATILNSQGKFGQKNPCNFPR